MTTLKRSHTRDFADEVDAIAPRAKTHANAATIAAADRRARQRNAPNDGPIVIGSAAHKHLCSRLFRETFNAY